MTPPEEGTVMGAGRGQDHVVLEESGLDHDVLGGRRSPSTGDNTSFLIWGILLGGAVVIEGIWIATRKITPKNKKK